MAAGACNRHARGTAAPGARSGHGGARNPQRAPGGNREQGGDAILSADGWIGPGHASVGGAAGKESWEGRRRDWRAELDAVRERVQAGGYGGGCGDKKTDDLGSLSSTPCLFPKFKILKLSRQRRILYA